jgi:hypothetical protein
LHEVPENPYPSYQRLSRYDEMGLIWLLRGRIVVALTVTTAAIQNPFGGTLTYYRLARPDRVRSCNQDRPERH